MSHFWRILFGPYGLLACLLFVLVFCARLIAACFSESHFERIRKRPKFHIIWGFLAFLSAMPIVFLFLVALHICPPAWMELRDEGRLLLERVQTAGGWDVLKRDCHALAKQYQDPSTEEGYVAYPRRNNNLPPAIAALRPKDVEYYPPGYFQKHGEPEEKWFGSNAVAHILIFGGHRTGAHDQPRLGLDVILEPGSPDGALEHLHSETPVTPWNYQKMTNGIYEFY